MGIVIVGIEAMGFVKNGRNNLGLIWGFLDFIGAMVIDDNLVFSVFKYG